MESPPDSTTKQTLVLPGRTLAFAATAGSIRLFDDKGEPLAGDYRFAHVVRDGLVVDFIGAIDLLREMKRQV